MARGVDIPEVDWVIQFDPPSSAKYDMFQEQTRPQSPFSFGSEPERVLWPSLIWKSAIKGLVMIG